MSSNSDIKSVQLALEEFRVENGKEPPHKERCNTLLSKLKLLLLKFQLFPPFTSPMETVRQQLLLARETYELAALLSIRIGDDKAFERTVTQLKTFYYDYASILPESERKWPIMGLSLMNLLASNRIAEFHTELELIPSTELNPPSTPTNALSLVRSSSKLSQASVSNVYISFPVALEQRLTEGSYNKILLARSNVPLAAYNFFLDKLVDTVRAKISDCNEKAYVSLPCDDARNLLMLKSSQELYNFARSRGWTIKDNTVFFNKKQNDGPQATIPSQFLIKQLLTYATELERIV